MTLKIPLFEEIPDDPRGWILGQIPWSRELVDPSEPRDQDLSQDAKRIYDAAVARIRKRFQNISYENLILDSAEKYAIGDEREK